MARWIRRTEPMALGELGLTPWEFERYTPKEIGWMVAGYHRETQRRWYQIATLGMWILAPHTKKRLTPERLLGSSWRRPVVSEPEPESDD